MVALLDGFLMENDPIFLFNRIKRNPLQINDPKLCSRVLLRSTFWLSVWLEDSGGGGCDVLSNCVFGIYWVPGGTWSEMLAPLTASPTAQLENESKLTVSIILGEEIS